MSMSKMKLILNESLVSNKDSDILEDVSVQAKPDYQIVDITVIPDETYYPTIQSILIDLDENNKLCESAKTKIDINILSETVNQKTGYSNSLFEFESENHTITLSLVLQETDRRGIYKVEAYTTKGIKVFESTTYKPKYVIESYLNSLANEYLVDKSLKESEDNSKEEFHKFAEKMKRLGFLDIKDMTSLSDNDFVDKLSFSDLNMFNKLENISYKDIQDMIRKELNEAEDPIMDDVKEDLAIEPGSDEEWQLDELYDDEPEEPVEEEYSIKEFMRGKELATQVRDLNIDYSNWNEMTPEEREDLVRPEISRFVQSYKSEFDKNPAIFKVLTEDLTDADFHTEVRVLEDEYLGGE